MIRICAFLAAVVTDWIGKMSGGAGLILTVLGFFISAEKLKLGFLIFGIACLFYASFRAWLAADKQREELLRKLQPKLEFIYRPGIKPFFEEFPNQAASELYYYRVGVRNSGSTDIPQARLVLEACDPNASDGIHLEHELQPMGKPDGTLSCFVGAKGTVYFDVAAEVVSPDQSFTEMHLCYAQKLANRLSNRAEPYGLILRAEGGGPAIRCSAYLGSSLRWRLEGLKMIEDELFS
jgi:hypothetical protein